MHLFDSDDEPICPVCLNTLSFDQQLSSFSLCSKCLSELKVVKEKFKVDGRDWYVLYEYNEFIERLFFRFKEQRDIALAPIFIQGHQEWIAAILKGKTCCVVPSGQIQRQKRGFEPLLEIFLSMNVILYSPFYKQKEHKQSSLNPSQRKEISSILQPKKIYPKLEGDIVWMDDVCTTGATLNKCVEWKKCTSVLVLAAHPKWIEQQREKRLLKKGSFW